MSSSHASTPRGNKASLLLSTFGRITSNPLLSNTNYPISGPATILPHVRSHFDFLSDYNPRGDSNGVSYGTFHPLKQNDTTFENFQSTKDRV